MAVDKNLTVTFDLSKLTQEGAKDITDQFDDVIKKAQKPKKKTKRKLTDFEKQDVKTEKRLKKLIKDLEFETISNKGKRDSLGNKIFGRVGLGQLIGFQQNPVSFIGSFAKQLVPFLGPALLATGVIAKIIQKIDNFQKQFVDKVDDRIDVFRSKEQQAQIQAGLTQLIITTSTGGAEPRDAYNTFAVFNENQSKIESDFQIRNTSGVD